MGVKLQLEIQFAITRENEPVNESERSYGGQVKINTFINEFFNHPQAVNSYYRSYFMDKFMEKSTSEWDTLAKLLNYTSNFGPLFCEIAKNCPRDVAEFITDIYDANTPNLRDKIRKEIDRRLLENQLRTLTISSAHFFSPLPIIPQGISGGSDPKTESGH